MAEYKITVTSNPRTLWVLIITAVLIGASIALTIMAGPIIGIVCAGFSAFIIYKFVSYTLTVLQHRVITDENGITFQFDTNKSTSIPWEEITHTGEFQTGTSRKYHLFVYREPNDTFMKIPPEFADFSVLREEIRRHTGNRFSTVELSVGTTIEEHLRQLLATEGSEKGGDSSDDQEALSD